jgi:hypothetical protein
MGLEYDDGKLGTFLSLIVGPIIGFVFWLPSEIIFTSGLHLDPKVHSMLSYVAGMLLLFGLDVALHMLRKYKSKGFANKIE